MTGELEQRRAALASEIEHLRIQRDELAGREHPEAVEEHERWAVKAEREHVQSERELIAAAVEQRSSDRGRANRTDEYGVDHVVEAALERQRISLHTDEQDKHLATINGSIEKTAKALEALVVEVTGMKDAREKETLVTEALAKALVKTQEGGLTKTRLYISVISLFLPLLGTLLVVIFK